MAEEVSPEKAKEIVEMLTGGGSIESINTSLALGILPLVESVGDADLLHRLVEHAQQVAEDDIEKGWARFEHLKRTQVRLMMSQNWRFMLSHWIKVLHLQPLSSIIMH